MVSMSECAGSSRGALRTLSEWGEGCTSIAASGRSHILNISGLSLLMSVKTLRSLLTWTFGASSCLQKVGQSYYAISSSSRRSAPKMGPHSEWPQEGQSNWLSRLGFPAGKAQTPCT